MSEKIDALIKAIYEPTPQGTGWSDHVARSAKTAYKDLMAAQRRLAHLDQWLESRGLPRNWDGPLNASAWILCERGEFGCGVGNAVCIVYGQTGDVHMKYRQLAAVEWDRATPEQRAAALAIRDGEGRRDE